ncbi:hypothetical protein PLESTB_000114300 [Pleodorina starrii]|uniref:Uncharacterized protein n=1 Tax=Pleodorina starrii TaxID=330485 RepID=A0A9W6BAQ0_9CHLO|nr:hypothetical protein PLESTM_000109900 [Pleodorina starrii]GLC48589.1 hypothetical protein PLESTB_000114300 [Pleodorina starrii]GLC71910.1 hypothetical protein PLESTF_001180000 [Pleodorina starrii]
MGPAVFELSPDRGPWSWTLLWGRGKATLLQSPQLNRALQAMAMGTCGGHPSADGVMWVAGAPAPPEAQQAAAEAACCHKLQPQPSSTPAAAATVTLQPPATAAAALRTPLRLLLSDLAMILCQLLLFINHYRRLLDANLCAHLPAAGTGVPAPGPLAAYPCSAPTPARIAFLAARADATFRASLALPLGEMWVPLVTAAILGQVVALLLLPRAAYLAFGRRACMVAVGLLPKAASLVSFLAAFPDAAAPSSYFGTYLPLEGAIVVWQQVVYNYPFWPGMAVLAAHCALSTVICTTVPPRLAAAGSPPLFSPGWVLVQTYACAALAAVVALQQHPASARALRAAQRSGAAAAATALEGASAGTACAPLPGLLPPAQCSTTSSANISSGVSAGSGLAKDAQQDAQLKAAVRRLLTGNRSSGSCTSNTGSVSFTRTAPSSSAGSLGSSAAPSEPGSAAGSGSHAVAVGAAQAAAGRSDAAAASPPSAQKPWRQPTQGAHSTAAAAAAARAAAPLMAYESRNRPAGQPSSACRRLMGTAPLLAAGESPAAAAAAPCPPAAPVAPAQVPYASPGSSAGGSRPSAAAASPPSGSLPPPGAFSLKQPTGLSKWTIVEDQEFEAPAAAVGVGMGASLDALGHAAGRGRRVRRYQSRAPPQRVHMKIPWAEPDQLPGNFLERLNLALSEGLDCMAVGVSVRAGCIELVFDVVPQAAFDSASDYQAGQSRRRHVQQHHDHHHRLDQPPISAVASFLADAAPLAPLTPLRGEQQQQQPQRPPGHLDLLGLVGPGAEAICAIGIDGGIGGGGGGEAAGADPHGALEAAVLSGLLRDAEPSSWIDALHLQPPPGAEVLTQACGRVWISRWDHTLRQWVPEKVGGIRPSQLPRIAQLRPPCIVVRRREAPAAASPQPSSDGGNPGAGLQPVSGGGGGGAVVRVTVTNADGATPPAFSARCRGRYIPVVARRMRASPSDSGWRGGEDCRDGDGGDERRPGAAAAASSPGEQAVPSIFELELPSGLPRNGLVVVECKVGKLLSNWRPLIVTEDPQLAAELESLLVPPAPQPPACPDAAANSYAAALALAAAADAAFVDADADADGGAGWDELANDLGLWLDYLEVLGLNTEFTPSLPAADTAGAVDDGAEAEASDRHAPAAADSAAAAADPAAAAASAGGVAAQAEGAAAAGSGAGAAEVGSLGLDLGPGLAALYATEGYGAHMAGIGASLLEFAVDRGWSHTADLLVRQMLAAGVPWSEVLRRCSSDGLTLLHRAVRSGRADVVELVVALGEKHGTTFDWQAVSLNDAAGRQAGDGGDGDASIGGGGAAGMTPLHLAASLPDGGRLAERILREYQAACQLWGSTVDCYGLRPADCARASGHLHLADSHRAGTAGAAGGGEAAVAAAAATSPPPPGPSGTVGMSTNTISSVGALSGGGAAAGGDEAGNARGGGASHRHASPPQAAPARTCARVGLALAGAAAAATAALRGVAALLAAPFVGDRDAESKYVQAVGSEFVLWCCGYLVFQMCTVFAVYGRMVKEGRAHEMVGMALFCAPHFASAALLCAHYGAWLALREPLCVTVTLTRTAAKLAPVLGLLPYPNSARNYLSVGMDVLLEGLIVAYFERMRAPFVLPLRALEGIATGLLYTRERVQLRLAPPGVSPLAYALAWNLGCGVITAAIDAACRRRFAAAAAGAGAAARFGRVASSGADGGGWMAGLAAAQARGGGGVSAAQPTEGAEAAAVGPKWKKVD